MEKLRFVTPILLTLTLIFSFACAGVETSQVAEAVEEPEEVEEDFVIDIPSLLGKDAFEVKEVLKESLGEPTTFREPEEFTEEETELYGEPFGTLSWNIEIEETGNVLMFGYDYYADGSIADNVFIIWAFKEQGESVMHGEVLKWVNLERFHDDYSIETKNNTLDMVELWIEPK